MCCVCFGIACPINSDLSTTLFAFAPPPLHATAQMSEDGSIVEPGVDMDDLTTRTLCRTMVCLLRSQVRSFVSLFNFVVVVPLSGLRTMLPPPLSPFLRL